MPNSYESIQPSLMTADEAEEFLRKLEPGQERVLLEIEDTISDLKTSLSKVAFELKDNPVQTTQAFMSIKNSRTIWPNIARDTSHILELGPKLDMYFQEVKIAIAKFIKNNSSLAPERFNQELKVKLEQARDNFEDLWVPVLRA